MAHYGQHVRYTSDRLSGYERQQVDIAQTGFFEGREFRTFFEFNIAAAGSRTFKFVAPCEFILFGQDLVISSGQLRYEARTGATEGGSFSTTLPIIGKNRMLERRFPYYVPQAVATTGGTATGGTVTDLAIVDTSNQSGSKGLGLNAGDERGLPAGTYYITLSNPGASPAAGIYRLWWEERAKHPDWKAYNTA